jgi:hypothetical protein
VGLMNVLSQEGKSFNIQCNALLPTAESRMSAGMPATQLAEIRALFADVGQYMGDTGTAPFVMPLAVYLVSEACKSTHGIYSAAFGRYAQVFVAASDGWVGRRDAPPSVDDIAAHFGEITSRNNLFVPASLLDEFAEIFKLLKKG